MPRARSSTERQKDMPRTTIASTPLVSPSNCRTRLTAHLAPDDLLKLRTYLELCLAKGQFPPYRGRAVDTVLLSEQSGIETRALASASPTFSLFAMLCAGLWLIGR